MWALGGPALMALFPVASVSAGGSSRTCPTTHLTKSPTSSSWSKSWDWPQPLLPSPLLLCSSCSPPIHLHPQTEPGKTHLPGVLTFPWLARSPELGIQKVLVTQSCPILCNPMDSSPPGSSVHGILQARILLWVAISFCGGSSQPRDQILQPPETPIKIN